MSFVRMHRHKMILVFTTSYYFETCVGNHENVYCVNKLQLIISHSGERQGSNRQQWRRNVFTVKARSESQTCHERLYVSRKNYIVYLNASFPHL